MVQSAFRAILGFMSPRSLPPSFPGVRPYKVWSLPALLDEAGAAEEARSAFARRQIMLFHGGWQSWSPGWELFPGEVLPEKVSFFPELYALTAAPWELGVDGRRAPAAGGASWISGSFIMYLRAAEWYLVLAAEADEMNPVVFITSPDRQTVAAGLYRPEDVFRAGGSDDAQKFPVKVFCAKGIFALKDALAALYRQEENFRRLDFLGMRPGGYASWYNHYTRINETIILRDLDGVAARENLVKLWYLDRGKPAVFQIDDGWQKAVGDWEVNARRFPRGMKAVAANIESAGMIPGLWIAPFIVTKKARVYRERPDWLLRDEEGNLVRAGWNPNWDGVYYCLDISREDVLAYLEGVTGAALDWGFRYLKLDFLYAGFLGRLSPAAYDRACAVLTTKTADSSGKSAAYLGCGLPLGASYRRFPLSRTGTDTRESWDWKAAKFLGHLGRPSALLNLRDTLGRSFLNGSVYKSDPDVVFLRTKNCKLSENEKELIILVNFMFAGQLMHSDDAASLCEADRALTRRVMARCEKLDGDEYGATLLSRDVYRIESRSGRVNGIVNLSDAPVTAEEIVPPHSIRL